jgi:hypothetical protein
MDAVGGFAGGGTTGRLIGTAGWAFAGADIPERVEDAVAVPWR